MPITTRTDFFFCPTETKMTFLVVFEYKYPPVPRLFMTEGYYHPVEFPLLLSPLYKQW